MASQPPPESYIFDSFKGLRNNVNAERLAPSDLASAINVDLDDAGQASRRRGYTRKLTGRCHSAFSSARATYVVQNGVLGVVDRAYNFTSTGFAAGTDTRIAYVQVGANVYLSSPEVSGIILPNDTVVPWGEVGGDRTWLSPVVNPTATLGAVRGKLLGAPPMASALGYLNGRIYLAQGPTLWATELYLYNLVDKTRTFLQFEEDITLIAPVSDGMYVGTKVNTWFLTGPFAQMRRTIVDAGGGGVPGSVVSVDPQLVAPNSQSKAATMFLAQSGIMVGLDGGQLTSMTQDKLALPDAQLAAAMFRRQDGINQYIGVIDSEGTPTATARIGDYVEAEVRRFRGA